MKSLVNILAYTALAAVLACSCSKTDSPRQEGSNIIRLSVQAEKDFGTKVSYSPEDNKFAFQEGDMMEILIGKTSGTTVTAQTTARIPMDAGNPGFFTGAFDLGEYDISDIRGAVLVRNSTPAGKYTLGFYNSTLTVYFKMSANQTQSEAGSFTDDTGRFMLYAPITAAKVLTGDDDEQTTEVSIDKLTFKICSGMFEYHIYGAGREDEKILSVTASAAGSSVSSSYIMTCNHGVNAASAAHTCVNGNYSYASTVELSTPFNIPSDQDNAAVVYHCVYGSGSTTRQLSTITVVTDKAIYKYNPGASASPVAAFGSITPIYINLAVSGLFARASKNYEISTDGGTTWSEWTGNLPSGTSFTSLKVRSGASLTSAKLTEIRTWIDSQAAKVALDLSGIEYEAITFPAAFGNSTAADACTKLGSIKFPSNVTGFASGAFRNCTGLADVDFSNITSISGEGTDCHTFRGCTALTEINLPKLTTMGRYTFYGCSNLTKITFGPSVTKFGGRSMESCPKLADIYIYATTPPSQNGNTYFLKNSGTSVAADARKIHVPAGCVDTYNNFSCTFNSTTLTPWKESITGYTLVEMD